MAKSYDIPWLLQQIKTGLRPKYLYFWSHEAARAGQIDQACLSQWWPAGFAVAGEQFASAEHYMMAAKARLFADETTRAQILAAPHPGAAKALGRVVADFDEATWQLERSAIVITGNLAKFRQNEALANYLLRTGQRILVEASPVDSVWGIGLAVTDPAAADPRRWRAHYGRLYPQKG